MFPFPLVSNLDPAVEHALVDFYFKDEVGPLSLKLSNMISCVSRLYELMRALLRFIIHQYFDSRSLVRLTSAKKPVRSPLLLPHHLRIED